MDEYNKYRRFFSVLASDDHSMFILTLDDLALMRTDYKEYYNEIFKDSMTRLYKLLALKEDAIKRCSTQQFNWIIQNQNQ